MPGVAASAPLMIVLAAVLLAGCTASDSLGGVLEAPADVGPRGASATIDGFTDVQLASGAGTHVDLADGCWQFFLDVPPGVDRLVVELEARQGSDGAQGAIAIELNPPGEPPHSASDPTSPGDPPATVAVDRPNIGTWNVWVTAAPVAYEIDFTLNATMVEADGEAPTPEWHYGYSSGCPHEWDLPAPWEAAPVSVRP